MTTIDPNRISRDAWDANAEHWDLRLGDEGNDFQNGFILDGFDERSFPPDHPQTTTLGWGGKFSEIPPALIARLRLSPS